MIDLHSHILPGIDDGCKSMDHSIAMARIYTEVGFHTVVATPHYLSGTAWSPAPAIIIDRAAELNQALSEREIGLQVVSGMEIGMDPAIAELLAQKKILPMGSSSCVLIEAPFQQMPLGWNKILFDVISSGYRIVLAHPERCEQLMREPELFQELVNMGCLMQLDWGSLLGHHGSKSHRLARELLTNGYVHCLATDSHDLEYRSPKIVTKGREMLARVMDDDKAHAIVTDNPKRILDSQKLDLPQPHKPLRKKRRFRSLFSWGQRLKK